MLSLTKKYSLFYYIYIYLNTMLLKKHIFSFEDLLAYPKNLRQIHCKTTLLALL